MASAARSRSAAIAAGVRRRRVRWRSPCTATPCPAAAISASSEPVRRTCSPTTKNVARAVCSRSSSSTAGVPRGCGPSSNVSATARASGTRRAMRSAALTGGATGASAGAHQAAPSTAEHAAPARIARAPDGLRKPAVTATSANRIPPARPRPRGSRLQLDLDGRRPMTASAEGIEAALIDTVCSRVRERVDGADAERVERFVRLYYGWVPPEDLAGRDPLDIYGAALAHWNLMYKRAPGRPRCASTTRDFEQHGWQSTHTVVEIVTDDMPFLVDSVSMELSRQAYASTCRAPRDRASAATSGRAGRDRPAGDRRRRRRCGVDHARRDRPPERAGAARGAREGVLRVLGDVRAAVEDWPAMRERAREHHRRAATRAVAGRPGDIDEAAALLDWLDDGHFTFLGYREYGLVDERGEDRLRAVPDSGLGILRAAPPEPVSERSPSCRRASAPTRAPSAC